MTANIILSRELIAADYGVAGFAMICVAFMKNFSGFGINRAAVHAAEFDEKAMATAFTLRQIIGVIAFGITIAFSGLAEHFIDHKAITSVIRVLAFAILIDNFSLVSTIHLERNLKFSVISLAETGLTAASSIIAILLALNGFKYWSIVYAFLAANTVFVAITFWYMPYRFKFSIDTEIAKQYLRYGSTVFLTGLLSFAVFNMDNFIVGSVAGVSQLGYYAIAFNWGSMVCSIMGTVVFGVLFPTFSRMQGDLERMKQAYLKIVQYTALLSVLCNVGLFCVADNFLITVLGKGTDKWLPSLMTLRILCLYGIIRSLIEPATSLLMAQGKAHIALKASLLVALVELALVYPAIKYGGIEVVGIAVLFAYMCQLAIYLPALHKTNNIRLIEIVKITWPALVAGGITLLGYLLLNGLFTHGLLKLVVSVFLLTSVYLLFYGVLTRWRIFHQLRDLLPARN
ncbi:MAG: lipopolysaccharide biosynthesis protein [Desulfuromonadaceae bacterium]